MEDIFKIIFKEILKKVIIPIGVYVSVVIIIVLLISTVFTSFLDVSSASEKNVPNGVISYESLNLTDSDKEILYKITSAERGGGTQEQQEYVTSVILNRVLSSGFKDTVYDVVFAPNQFQPTTNGAYDAAKPSDTTKAAVDNVIATGDKSKGALFFMVPSCYYSSAQGWISDGIASGIYEYLFNDVDESHNNPSDSSTHNFFTNVELKKELIKKYASKSNDTTNNGQNSDDGDGYSTTYTANGRTYKEFKQSQGSYKGIRFSSGYVSDSGCGPTSAAIVLSGYGKSVNPGDTATKMMQNGQYPSSGATIQWVLKQYDVDAHAVYSPSKEQMKEQLKKGRPFVISVTNALNGRYTGGGHLMAVLDIKEENGKTMVYISNPNPRTYQGWDTLDNLYACRNYAIFVDDDTKPNNVGNKNDENNNEDNSNKGEEVVEIAKKQLGKPYVYGATGPNSFDCTGLVLYCCKQANVSNLPPRRSQDYKAHYGEKYRVSLSNLQTGDLLSNEGHVGIYIGNNNFIHAPGKGKYVKIESLNNYKFERAYRPWK